MKGIISWTNPTTNTDGTAFDAATEGGGYTLQFDGVGAVSIPFSAGVTSFDMNTLPAYTSLKSGNHTAALAIVTKTGVASDYSAPATFHVDAVPNAPSHLAVA